MGVTINYLLLIVNGQQLFKKGGGGDIALEVTSYQLPVTSNRCKYDRKSFNLLSQAHTISVTEIRTENSN